MRGLPMTKDTYHRRYPLPDLCRGGRIEDSDMIAVSSGSTGRPSIRPRSLVDELHIVRRFEEIFRDGSSCRSSRRTSTRSCCSATRRSSRT
jgi:phenylacetate-CoA ligase